MTALDIIHACLAEGRMPTLETLGGPEALIAEADALVAAPVLDVLVQIADEADDRAGKAIDPIILRGFAEARQPIPFRDAIDVMLASDNLLSRHAKPLQRILSQRVEARGLGQVALISAYALEALFPMSLSKLVSHHRPLALMVEIGTNKEDGQFAAHAAKLAGAAYHVWRDPDLLAVLERLLNNPDAEEEAAFELGLGRLSQAFEATDSKTAIDLLEAAHVYFDRSRAMGDGREDAVAYCATVDIIRGFARNASPEELDHPLSQLEDAVARRAAWLDVVNMPEWLRPRLDRDAQWARLVRVTRSVATDLQRSSWLNAATVMEQVLAVYDADRTLKVGAGLDSLLRPRIEAAFTRERGLLAHLDDLLALEDWSPLLRDTAAALRHRIAILVEGEHPPGKSAEDAPFPLLGSVLQDEQLIRAIDPQAAAQLEAALVDHVRFLDDIGHPIVQRIMARLSKDLATCNDYVGEVKRDFDQLTLHILTFCCDRLDAARNERGERGEYLYRGNATEWDLQSDFRHYLQGNMLRADVRTEVEGVAAGRADIYVSFGKWRFIIELKRDNHDVSRAGLRRYFGQAGAYQVTNVRLGFLGVLDLMNRDGPPPHLEENVWKDEFVPQGASLPRHLMVFRVAGKLQRPSAMRTPSSPVC